MTKIKAIKLFSVIDSRGYPTVCCLMYSSSGNLVRAMSPSGASCGSYEAVEKRDQDPTFYFGKGLSSVIHRAEQSLIASLIGFELESQQSFDQYLISMDGTKNKSHFGANVIVSLSMAYAKLSAKDKGLEYYQYLLEDRKVKLPVPLVNVLNGGVHADNNINIQEFMIVPHGFDCFFDAIRAVSEIFYEFKKISKSLGYSINVGDEGGLAPNLTSCEAAFELLNNAIDSAGYEVGSQVSLALDCAANEFYKGHRYSLEQDKLTPHEWVNQLAKWVDKYFIISIEDALAENDHEGWSYLMSKIGHKVQCVGDDLFVTNVEKIQTGIDHHLANAVLIKPNQVGSVYETHRAIHLSQQIGWQTIMSHRSGDTEDCFIADYCVGMALDQIKTGSICRAERTAKYNRLLEIEALNSNIEYARPFSLILNKE